MKSKGVAYLLWVLGIFGCLGLHNFYLNRPIRGIIWIFTFGLYGLGSIYDLFTISKDVKRINSKIGFSNSEFINRSNIESASKQESIPDFSKLENSFVKEPLSQQDNVEVITTPRYKVKVTITQSDDLEFVSDFVNEKLPLDQNIRNKSQFSFRNDDGTDIYNRDQLKHFESKIPDLSNDKKELLKQFFPSHRKFSEIEQCNIETAKYVLNLYSNLDDLMKNSNTSLKEELEKIETAERNEYFYHLDDSFERFYTSTNHFLSILEQICENDLRKRYFYNRSLDTEQSYIWLEENLSIQKEQIDDLLNQFKEDILTKKSEIQINTHCVSRWKEIFKTLDPQEYTSLLLYNKENPNLYKIYHQCFKKTYRSDPETSLYYYSKHLNLCIGLQKKASKINSVEEKHLFKNEKQKQKYYEFLSSLSIKSDDSTLRDFCNEFYLKRIEFNAQEIENTLQKHKSTSKKLEEILEDDQEVESINKIQLSTLESVFTDSSSNIDFTAIEKKLIKLFKSNSYSVDKKALKAFAKDNKVLSKKIINSLNQKVYELEEDNLINLEEDCYEMDHTLITNYIENGD